MTANVLATAEEVVGLPAGIRGWTTTRENGSFGLGSTEPVGDVIGRWRELESALATLGVRRLATAHQVHGADITVHGADWTGWLRGTGADGHITTTPGTALAVTVADCTPVLVSHPRGAAAALHAGWRGTAAGILERGLDQLAQLGFPAQECDVYLGPSICGDCYEVGPEVMSAVTGQRTSGKAYLDVRAILAEQATRRGVASVRIDAGCTRCHQHRYFSHRGGDAGRQLGIIALL